MSERSPAWDALATPALVVDAERLHRNIERMAAYAASYACAVRPRAKTHKTVEVARRQVAAGACGLTVAKVGEAEALGAAARGALAQAAAASPGLRLDGIFCYRATSGRNRSIGLRRLRPSLHAFEEAAPHDLQRLVGRMDGRAPRGGDLLSRQSLSVNHVNQLPPPLGKTLHATLQRFLASICLDSQANRYIGQLRCDSTVSLKTRRSRRCDRH